MVDAVSGAGNGGRKSGCVTCSSSVISRMSVVCLLMALFLVCELVPTTSGFSARADDMDSTRDPDVPYNMELYQRMLLLSKLLKGRPVRLSTSMLPVHQSEEGLVAGKRGPTSCINSCLTGGMSFVRCKSMCHW